MNDRFLEDLKDRIDLVELISKYTEIKKTGKNYMCKSPFRNERTPSFSISPDRGLWYDFGASEGGDAITFIEKIENFSFREAIEHLAEITHIEVPKAFGQDKVKEEIKDDIFTLHEAACKFFEQKLQESKFAQDYLKSRGYPKKTWSNWRLGFGGESEDGLSKYLRGQGFTEKKIAESGVAFERSFGKKTMRDRFFKRLIIPVFEPRNSQIIAFTARELYGEKNTAKYLNSPENPVYHKSSTLFGLEKARDEIRKLDAAILVEGNFDVISAHEQNFKNVIATCGTSLTEDHLRILKRFTKNIICAFDSDLAGKKATLRATEMIFKQKLEPKIIDIQDAKDFDDLAQKNPKQLKKIIQTPKPALNFFLEKFSQKNLNNTLEGEKKFLDSFFYFLKFSGRPIEIDDFLQKISAQLKRPKNIIEQEFQRFIQKMPKQKQKFIPKTKIKKFTREEILLGFLSSNWKHLQNQTTEETIKIFSEHLKIKEILNKKINNQELTKEEQSYLSGLEIYAENLYGEIDQKFCEQEFQTFQLNLKKENEKKDRLQNAQKFREEKMN